QNSPRAPRKRKRKKRGQSIENINERKEFPCTPKFGSACPCIFSVPARGEQKKKKKRFRPDTNGQL
ncbi:hypothetical protein IscW_ISCW018840, partial [Ixodes scapularis]